MYGEVVKRKRTNKVKQDNLDEMMASSSLSKETIDAIKNSIKKQVEVE
jgi:hypothetical protein